MLKTFNEAYFLRSKDKKINLKAFKWHYGLEK